MSNSSASKPRLKRIARERLEFRALEASCPTKGFVCGNVPIERYFERAAHGHHASLFARVTTLHVDAGRNPVGYYATSLKSEPEYSFEPHASFYRRFRAKFLSRSLIVFHLNRLAVHSDFQRQGLGTLMMGRVISDFREVTSRCGLAAMTLKPLPNVIEFYEQLGFSAFAEGMYLSAEAVLDL